MRSHIIRTALVLAAIVPSRASAQDSLAAAKSLYASAAYEEALTALEKLDSAAQRLEAQQYRAFCLVALERRADAEKAIAAVLTATPTYVPDPAEVSPRIRDAFLRVRRELLPDLSRRLYLDAKSALDRKDRSAAIVGFRTVLDVIDASAPVDGSVAELRMLAEGFLQLSEALPVEEPPKPEPAAVAPPIAQAPRVVFTPAVAITQRLPIWNPPDSASANREFAGAVRVMIDATGKVQSTEIVRSIHPAYNEELSRAAKLWVYDPARENGVAVASEKIVEVRLRPRP